MNHVFSELSKGLILKKRAMLGFEEGDDTHVTVLNRLVDFLWIDGVPTLTYEPDSRHADLLARQVGMTGQKVKGVGAPGEKRGDYYDTTALAGSLVTVFRSCTMRLAYLAADLPHL